jgi:hypothetical protein
MSKSTIIPFFFNLEEDIFCNCKEKEKEKDCGVKKNKLHEYLYARIVRVGPKIPCQKKNKMNQMTLMKMITYQEEVDQQVEDDLLDDFSDY